MSRVNDLLTIYKKKLKGETDFTPEEKELIKECKEIMKNVRKREKKGEVRNDNS